MPGATRSEVWSDAGHGFDVVEGYYEKENSGIGY